MILKNLSLYDVSIEHGGVVAVRSLHFRFKGRKLRPSDVRGTKYWTLYSDNGRKYNLSEGKLRFLLRSPQVSMLDIDCRATKVSFRSDGGVIPMGRTLGKRRCNVFRDYDDALETVRIMRDFSLGNVAPLCVFCDERKQDAVHTIARLRGISPRKVELAWDDALLKFEDKVRNLNVRRIMPLFALLCQQLRLAVAERFPLRSLRHGSS